MYFLICLGILKNSTVPSVPNVPNDFFESPTSIASIKPIVKKEIKEEIVEDSEIIDDENLDKGELPKGFFDDPMLDAKVSFSFDFNVFNENVLNFKC